MAVASAPPMSDYSWQDCDDFQIPDNSVWFGVDDDGSDIFCGKAWSDGREVPAKIIPQRRECRVRFDNGEKVVPYCKKVLICKRSRGDDCVVQDRQHHGRRGHCHRRRRCRRDCSSSSSESEDEESPFTKTTSTSQNQSRLYVRSIRCISNSTTTVVKKHKKKRRGKSRDQECWNEQRTRMVPRVTQVPRIRYVPKVTMERSVQYVPETYTTRVCAERSCCESSRDCSDSYDDCCESYVDGCEPFEPCVEPYQSDRRCREAIICEKPTQPTDRRCREAIICEKPAQLKEEGKGKGQRCVRPERSDSPKRTPKCW